MDRITSAAVQARASVTAPAWARERCASDDG
jgi:hypothetical protein